MSTGWKRVSECRLCGSARCVVSTVNERKGYCFRFAETFFINYYTGEVNRTKNKHMNVSMKPEPKKEENNQTFDFGDDE